MSEDIQESLRLLQFTSENADNLRKIAPFVEKDLPEVLGEFYRFLNEWDNLRVMFRGQEGMDFAKNAQVKHWLKICEGNFDETYVSSVRRIGLTHHRLNLEPKWYLGGYAFIMTRLVADLLKDKSKRSLFGKSDQELGDLLEAFIKAVFLDMTYAITVYLDEGKAEKEAIVSKLSSDIERDIGGIVVKIVQEMKSLEITAVSLNEISSNTSQISQDVAHAAEEASGNVSTVAAATEEISNSVQEVRATVTRSYEMTQEAVTQADAVGKSVTALVEAIGNIENVSSVIGDIAAQTNLLALNATIEAARAGEAGKGFAVVAHEVKMLANQTAQSTEQISKEIASIQALAINASSTIETVVKTIRQISDYALGMNNGMQEQAQATAEIARNIDEAANGTADVTRNINDVSHMSQKTLSVSTEVLHSARNMATQAAELENTLQVFLANLKKA